VLLLAAPRSASPPPSAAVPRPPTVSKKALAYYSNLAFTIHATMDNFVFFVVVETCIVLLKFAAF
jgi:hypothetical protein